MDGEKEIYKGKLHWVIFLKPAIIDVMLISVVIALVHQAQRDVTRVALGLSLVAFFFGLVMTSPALLKYWSSWIVVTNKRVIARTGLF